MKRSCRSEDVKKTIPLPLILKFPFITETVRHLVNCGQYKYLSITTDGSINPNPNQTRPGIARDNLMLEFDDGSTHRIEESIWNLNIETYGSFYFTNLNYDIMIGAHPCNGYGNIILILSVDQFPKTDKHIQPPHFCEQGAIANNAHLYYWTGKYRVNAAWSLLVPYIPLGYKDLRFQLSVTKEYAYKIRQYCCNDTVYCETAAGNIPAGVVTCIDVPLYSDRIYFEIHNTNLMEAGTFCIQSTWIRKGKF